MDFSSMSGWDFERYCADCLLKKGFTKAEVTSGSGDHGVDIIAEQNGIRFGIQCKLYQGQIPNKAVQEAYTGASYYDCDVAVIMSNSELTKQAHDEAKKLRVKFWNVNEYSSPESSNIKYESRDVNTKIDYSQFVKLQKTVDHNAFIMMNAKVMKFETGTPAIKLFPITSTSKSRYFQIASAWLEPENIQKETWYPVFQSIDSYCSEMKKIENTDDMDLIILDQLLYIEWLKRALSVIFNRYAVRILQSNNATPNFRWNGWYLIDQMQELFVEIEKVIQSFGTTQRDRIQKIRESSDEAHTYVENMIYVNAGWLKSLEEWWRKIPDFEENLRQKFLGEQFEVEDAAVKEAIKRDKAEISKTIRNQPVVEEPVEKGIEIKKEEIRTEQKQNVEEKQRLKEATERKATIQSLVDSYYTNCQEIQRKTIIKKKSFEDNAKNEIERSQNEIGTYLKRKKTFALFKRKRDAEIDAKIAVLDRHVEQVKQNLADELAKCEQDAEEKKNSLYERILDEAERSHVKDEVIQRIGK